MSDTGHDSDTTHSDSDTTCRDTVATDDTTATEEFVFVATAADRLGLNLRTAQRYSTKLKTVDREDGEGPRRVRYSAMAGLAKQRHIAADDTTSIPVATPKSDAVATEKRQPSDTTATRVHVAIGSDTVPASVLVDQLRQENANLRADLDHEREERRADRDGLQKLADQAQQLHLAGMAELEAVRRRAAELEAQVTHLIEALPMLEKPTPEKPATVKADRGDDAKTLASAESATSWTMGNLLDAAEAAGESANAIPNEGADRPASPSESPVSDDTVIARKELPPHSEAGPKQASWWVRLFGGGK